MSWRLRNAALSAIACCALSASVARAEQPSWLRSKNGDIEKGNEKLSAGDANGALEAYDKAARALPSEAGVHLNRGLALLKQGKLDAAREALKLATDSAGNPEVRSDAYYDLGIAFYRQAEASVAEKNDEEAQKAFREASDAFRKSIRQRPGNANAAYNYEVTQQRIVELEKKQQEKKDQEKQDQEKQDQEKKDDQQQQDQQGQDQDQQNPDGSKKDQPSEPKPDEKKPGEDQVKKPEPPKPEPKQAADQKEAQQAEEKQPQPGEQPLPADVKQALDALQNGEKNLEQQRAMQRGGHRRPPEKDW